MKFGYVRSYCSRHLLWSGLASARLADGQFGGRAEPRSQILRRGFGEWTSDASSPQPFQRRLRSPCAERTHLFYNFTAVKATPSLEGDAIISSLDASLWLIISNYLGG